MTRTILIVDDEINTLKVLSAALVNSRTKVETARIDGFEGLFVSQFWARRINDVAAVNAAIDEVDCYAH